MAGASNQEMDLNTGTKTRIEKNDPECLDMSLTSGNSLSQATAEKGEQKQVSNSEENNACPVQNSGKDVIELLDEQCEKLCKVEKRVEDSISRARRVEKGIKRSSSGSRVPSKAVRKHNLSKTVIKMMIIHKAHPDIDLSFHQLEIVRQKLLEALDAIPKDRPAPQFVHCSMRPGYLSVQCANLFTINWLEKAVSQMGELCDGAGLKVTATRNIPRRVRVQVNVPAGYEIDALKRRLELQNPGFVTSNWFLKSKHHCKGELTLVYSIDQTSFDVLVEHNFEAFVGLELLSFQLANNKVPAPF